MTSFRKRFVERNIQGALARNLISGKGMVAAFSRRYTRSNLAAELYDREVFDGKVFVDLPSRPVLRPHATDLALGRRFTFVSDTSNVWVLTWAAIRSAMLALLPPLFQFCSLR
jgi:NTE family protein